MSHKGSPHRAALFGAKGIDVPHDPHIKKFWDSNIGTNNGRNLKGETEELLNLAADFRKHRTSVCANQSHHPGDDDEDDCQHDGVFSDILSFGILPQPVQIAVHDCPLDSSASQPSEFFATEPEHGI